MINRKDNGNEDTKRVMEELDGYLPMCIRKEDQETIDTIMSVALPVIEVTNPSNYVQGQTRLRMFAEMLLHVHRHEDDMDLDTILVADYIEHYITVENEDESHGWQRTARAVLRGISQDANPQAWPVKPKNLKGIRVAVAYSEDEESAFRLAGELACHRAQIDRAFTVVGSLGLGLTGADIGSVESTHVADLGDGRLAVWVVRKNEYHLVPVRVAYTTLLRETLEQVGRGRFIHQKYCNAVPNIAQRIVFEGLGYLSLSRARSTWITAHLLAGTPLAALRYIAGPLAGNTLAGLMDAASKGLTPEEAALQGLRA